MVRPRKPRWVEFIPEVTFFKPAGVRMRDLEEVRLGIDELEALRLKDLLGLDQEECAKRMNLAQSSFQRLLSSARKTVSRVVIEGRALRIEGGNYLLSPRTLVCQECNEEWTNRHPGPHRSQCPSCGSENVEQAERRMPERPMGGHGQRRGRHR